LRLLAGIPLPFAGLWIEWLISPHEIEPQRIINMLMFGRQACLWVTSRFQLARLP
jgi:hypothetical protein